MKKKWVYLSKTSLVRSFLVKNGTDYIQKVLGMTLSWGACFYRGLKIQKISSARLSARLFGLPVAERSGGCGYSRPDATPHAALYGVRQGSFYSASFKPKRALGCGMDCAMPGFTDFLTDSPRYGSRFLAFQPNKGLCLP